MDDGRGDDGAMRIGDEREAGFTLVEVLVAFAIMALCVPALLEIFGTGFRAIRTAEVESAAARLAASKLAAVGSEIPFSAGRAEGREEPRFTWLVTIEPDKNGDTGAVQKLQGYWVVATVSWRDHPRAPAREVVVRTLQNGGGA